MECLHRGWDSKFAVINLASILLHFLLEAWLWVHSIFLDTKSPCVYTHRYISKITDFCATYNSQTWHKWKSCHILLLYIIHNLNIMYFINAANVWAQIDLWVWNCFSAAVNPQRNWAAFLRKRNTEFWTKYWQICLVWDESVVWNFCLFSEPDWVFCSI